MIPVLVSEIEGGYPERQGGEGADGEEEGLVLEYSRMLDVWQSLQRVDLTE